MSVKERIYCFVKHKGITIRRFEELCDLSNGYVSSMRKGLGEKKLSNVLSVFPELNRDWLIYGEGSMIKGSDVILDTMDSLGTVRERLTEYLSKKRISKTEFGRTIGASSAFVTSIQKTIGADKIQAITLNYPDLNIEWLLTGDGTMFRELEPKLLDYPQVSKEDVVNKVLEEMIEQRRLMSEVISMNKEMVATISLFVATNRELARTNSEVVLASREHSERFLLALERLTNK